MYLKPLPKIVHGQQGSTCTPPPTGVHHRYDVIPRDLLYQNDDVNIESTWPNYAYGALFIIDKILAIPPKL